MKDKLMKVSLSVENRYLIYASTTNIVAHLYFTLLSHSLYSQQALSKWNAFVSLLGIGIWLYGIKKNSPFVLLCLNPLQWLYCYFSSLPPTATFQDDLNQVIFVGFQPPHLLSMVLRPSYLLVPFILLISYIAVTLAWLSINKKSYRHYYVTASSEQEHKIDLSKAQYKRPWEASYIKWIPLYWGFGFILGLYIWSTMINLPDQLKDSEILTSWFMFFSGCALLSLFSGASMVLMKHFPSSYPLLENLQMVKVDRSWRKYIWLSLVLGLFLFFFTF